VTNDATVGAWVVDPADSRATFANKTFWGLVTVRGTFGAVSGSGTVAGDDTVAGELVIDAANLDTKNKQRDKHLRSADFFDTDKHPNVVVRVESATRDGDSFTGTGTVEAAGTSQPVTFSGHIDSADGEAVVLTASASVDRHAHGMTWNQLGMLTGLSTGTVTARFVRP
jgi:polyisoprenoid-binding protein YceI